ncbi:MAG: hypothetical protein JST40_14130 [Armatimonadetes bacterium]|nr:hypothetical protein [Armatimonadota bacterium]
MQVPELYRSATVITGNLRQYESGVEWTIDSITPITLIGLSQELSAETLHGWATSSEPIPCQALGTLSVVGCELAKNPHLMISGVVHGFLTLDLNSGSSSFGTWIEARNYGELGSDPDVIGAPVCLAELEIG